MTAAAGLGKPGESFLGVADRARGFGAPPLLQSFNGLLRLYVSMATLFNPRLVLRRPIFLMAALHTHHLLP